MTRRRLARRWALSAARLVTGGQRDGDLEPAAGEGDRADRSAVRLAHRVHNGQSETGTPCAGSFPAAPAKRLEQAGHVGLVHLEAGVADDEVRILVVTPAADPD